MAYVASDKKTSTSLAFMVLAISSSDVRNMFPRTAWICSSIAFACGFLTLVGIHFIPYVSHRDGKWSLNLLPLLYIMYWQRGYLLNQVYTLGYWFVLNSCQSKVLLPLVGKSAQNSAEFRDYSNSGPFELRNFHRNFIFLIVKCVPANLEHVSSSLESSPTIDSSNFMNRKMFLPSVFFWPVKKISSRTWQPVDRTMLNRVDVGTIPGKAILLTIILGWCDFCEQNNHATTITFTHFE